MTDTRHLLRLNIGFLIHQPIGTSRDFHFDVDYILLRPDLELNRFTGVTRISRTPQGLLVHGMFQGTTTAVCVRCLSDFQQPLEADFNELYAFNKRSITESGLILPEDGKIDLEPIVREYMVIEIPISPLCKMDCKGLCSICGADLNTEICEHQTSGTEQMLT